MRQPLRQCNDALTYQKETYNGRFKECQFTEDREDKLLRNLRLRDLFLRMPEKRMPLQGEQLSMWLPSARRRPVISICLAHRIPVGEVESKPSHSRDTSRRLMGSRGSRIMHSQAIGHHTAASMHILDLKVPPLALALLVGAAMWSVTWAIPAFGFTFPARHLFAMAAVGAGAIIAGMGIVSFRRAKTTVNPMKPDSSSSLVVSGVYRLTRDPMYLGFLLILLGWAIFISNALAFLLLPSFVFYMNRFQIEPEEQALTSLFGPAFLSYRGRVRRWI